jgi:hypothetical protein
MEWPVLTAYPRSVARVSSLKELPVKLLTRPWTVAIATLTNRTISPVVERFIECSRGLAKSMTKSAKVRTLVAR